MEKCFAKAGNALRRIKKESSAWLPHIRYGVGGQRPYRRATDARHGGFARQSFAPSFGGFVFIEGFP